MLDDGDYDVIVVDADPGPGASELRLELAILGGAHKGEVISMRAAGLGVDELEVLGMPGTLTVLEGDPTVLLDQ